MASAAELLAQLNAFRATENLAPFADWRKARHQPLLDKYLAAEAEVGKALDNFEASTEELAAQSVRQEITEGKVEEVTEKVHDIIDLAKADLEKLAASLGPAIKSTPEEIAARRAARKTGEKKVEAKPTRTLAYKELARIAPKESTLESPVQRIRDYLDVHYGTKKRKDIIAALVAMGINIHTCRTQYQIYHVKRNAPATTKPE